MPQYTGSPRPSVVSVSERRQTRIKTLFGEQSRESDAPTEGSNVDTSFVQVPPAAIVRMMRSKLSAATPDVPSVHVMARYDAQKKTVERIPSGLPIRRRASSLFSTKQAHLPRGSVATVPAMRDELASFYSQCDTMSVAASPLHVDEARKNAQRLRTERGLQRKEARLRDCQCDEEQQVCTSLTPHPPPPLPQVTTRLTGSPSSKSEKEKLRRRLPLVRLFHEQSAACNSLSAMLATDALEKQLESLRTAFAVVLDELNYLLLSCTIAVHEKGHVDGTFVNATNTSFSSISPIQSKPCDEARTAVELLPKADIELAIADLQNGPAHDYLECIEVDLFQREFVVRCNTDGSLASVAELTDKAHVLCVLPHLSH